MNPQEAAATQEIQNVISQYLRHFDLNEVEPLMDLFTEDCSAAYGDTELEDKPALREFVESSFSGETGVEDSFHMVMNPWIEVNGNKSVGRWHFLGAYTLSSVGAAWLTGFYTVEFRRQEEGWLIERLDFEEKWTTPYTDGWAETMSVDR